MSLALATKGRISGRGVTYGTLGYIHQYISVVTGVIKTEVIRLKSYIARFLNLTSGIDL